MYDEMQIIREKIVRDEQRQQEQRDKLRKFFAHQAELLDAISQARVVGWIGLLPSAIWIIKVAYSVDHPFMALFDFVFGFLVLGSFAYFGPTPYAGLASVLFRQGPVSTKTAAAILAALSDAILFGWIIVFTSGV